MNLLCITYGPMNAPATHGHWEIKFGEVYEGIGEYNCPIWGKYYFLSHDPRYAYAAEHFVVLPSDEEIAAEEECAELDQAFRDIILEEENRIA